MIRAGVAATKFRAAVAEGDRQPDHGHEPHDHRGGHDHHQDRHQQRGHGHHHGGQAHHSLKEIQGFIERSALSRSGKDRAIGLFERLAEAEAQVHAMPVERVHLHEVGALDSIVDIVGAVYGMEWLGADEIVASPLNVGSGTVECAHGIFPVPAPATALLLRGVPIYAGPVATEMVTPTGALLVTEYASAFGPLPAMRVDAIGYGAGDRDFTRLPNVLRILQGESVNAGTRESIVLLECEIDDMNPQLFGPLMDRLFEAGALDVFYSAVQMKKNRPGVLVTVLAPPAKRELMASLLFTETTTIGVRFQDVLRERLEREIADRGHACRADPLQDRQPRRPGAERRARVRRLRRGRRRAQDAGQGRPGPRDEGMAGTGRAAAGMSRFYITTPIYYINAEPHLGHAYTTIVADAIARARRLLGDDVFFLTGTDEHGQKVERAAKKAGLAPREFADRMAAKYRELFAQLNISNDDFIRTTEDRHIRASQEIWRRVRDRGYLYKATYEGWYCTVDELFVPEAQLVDGRLCPTCGNPVERLSEESYFFKLSEFQEPLLEHYRSQPGLRHARDPPQRDDRVRLGRTARSERQPHLVQVGHPGSRRSRARDVRLVRRAHELHHRGGVSRRPGAVRALLAG